MPVESSLLLYCTDVETDVPCVAFAARYQRSVQFCVQASTEIGRPQTRRVSINTVRCAQQQDNDARAKWVPHPANHPLVRLLSIAQVVRLPSTQGVVHLRLSLDSGPFFFQLFPFFTAWPGSHFPLLFLFLTRIRIQPGAPCPTIPLSDHPPDLQDRTFLWDPHLSEGLPAPPAMLPPPPLAILWEEVATTAATTRSPLPPLVSEVPAKVQ